VIEAHARHHAEQRNRGERADHKRCLSNLSQTLNGVLYGRFGIVLSLMPA
jgi:hypothetical protein